jgi:hypothetical protein
MLLFRPGQPGTISFGIAFDGTIACTTRPTPDPTTRPLCEDPVPTAPSVNGIQQDMRCVDTNLAQRRDCLGLAQRLPGGTGNGLSSVDCISGSQGTNQWGQLYCRWADSGGCSLVAVFGDQNAQARRQSRDDVVAVLNNSNAFCYRVCRTGPLVGSQITNRDGNVRLCVMETGQAANC